VAATDRNFQGDLLTELTRLVQPLADTAADPTAVTRVLDELGWELAAFPNFPTSAFVTALGAVSTAATTLEHTAENPPESITGWTSAAADALAAVKAIVNLSTVISQAGITGALTTIGQDLLNLLVVEYLRTWHPAIYRLFILLDIITEQDIGVVKDPVSGDVQRTAVTLERIDLTQVPRLLRDPSGTLNAVYNTAGGLPDPNGTADLLFPRVAALLQELNVAASYGADPSSSTVLGPDGFPIAQHTLVTFKPTLGSDDAEGGFGAALSLDSTLGLVVKPFGALKFTEGLKGWVFDLGAELTIDGFALSRTAVVFPQGINGTGAAFKFTAIKVPPVDQVVGGNGPAVLIGSTSGTRLELAGLFIQGHATLSATRPQYGISFAANDGALVIVAGDGDGFLQSVFGKETRIPFSLTGGWENDRGFVLGGGATLAIDLPSTIDIGPVSVSAVRLAIVVGSDVELRATANVRAELGPVTAEVQNLGLTETITFVDQGNLGPLNLSLGFRAPDGLGITVDAGSVTGGGFLFFDPANGRYGGALELKVYSVNVKAFGVVETKLPSGQSGFSFAIVISAEFTPIQLGLGFTLNGVGGIIGINRRIDQDALTKGVRTGALERLLFPHDVVHDAPQIIHDLQAILPPTNGRYIFGPLAKIGWGTPTIITAEIGIILELPGPRLALLGEVSALLPKKDKGIITLNLSVAGLLDFPKKYFAIDASLHDSKVGSYPVSGDMAMRMTWGDSPTFALAVGGFNPAFQPPAGFPKLRRVAVDLGVSGNPSLTLQGYFALTSNTAQFGALAELNASGSGVTLYARVQFDALIVFSPFSFEVDISAQVSIKFHGHGITAHLKGMLSGPSPWHVRGEVCVSILWWDACLSFDKTFGSAQKVELPSLDPWAGTPLVNGVQEVVGLQAALQDARNWTPEPPPAVFTVVSFANNTATNQLFDPLGVAVVKQSVCPFNLKLQRFGSAKALGTPTFTFQSATFGDATNSIPVSGATFKKEPFAKAQFVELTNAQKLSAPAFEPFDGAIRLPANDNKTRAGSLAGTDLTYQTKVLGAPAFEDHPLPVSHQVGMVLRSAVGLRGLRRTAAQAYLDPTALPRFTLGLEEFVIGNKNTLTTQVGLLTSASNKLQAILALNAHLFTNPEDTDVLQVYPKFEMGGR
jgi:hypothetical protein